jgi:penicillin-insensitive murein endopeptidase
VSNIVAHTTPKTFDPAALERRGSYSPLPLVFVVSLVFSGSAFANEWSQVNGPNRSSAQVIGQTNAGCLSGAQGLPLDGDGYRVVHLDRKRYFGHPALLGMLKGLGQQIARLNVGILHIGDMSQARGGPMPTGHRSHQSGIDVDVRFNLDPTVFINADALRANISAPSMLNLAHNDLDRKLWGQRQITVLEKAAQMPGVDRIFVNPHIKKDLCRRVAGNRGWLRRIRPWYGHDDHFHMRMSCPSGSPRCVPQEEIPAGDGCDASLDWWLEQPLPPSKPQPVPEPSLPPECKTVLKEHG